MLLRPILVAALCAACISDVLRANEQPLQLEEVPVYGVATNSGGLSNGIGISRSQLEVSGDEIDRLAAQSVEDLASLTAGISPSSLTAGLETSLSIRGFRTDSTNIILNGHYDNRRLFSRDLATVERVGIVKGHSSVFYGAGSPGGTIHYRTKRPAKEPKTEVALTLGTDRKRRIELDVTGPVGEYTDFRAVGVYQKADTFIENVNDNKRLLLLSLRNSQTPFGSILFELEYTHLANQFQFGIVRSNEEIIYDKSYVHPEASSDRRYRRSSLYWDKMLTDRWGLSATASYVDVNRSDELFGFFFKLDERSLAGFWRETDNRYWQSNVRVDLNGETIFAGTHHRISAGVDHNRADNNIKSLRSINAFQVDIQNPDFSGVTAPRSQASPADFHVEDTDSGIFLADQISIGDRIIWELGARYSEYKVANRLRNSVLSDQQALSRMTGLVWLPSDSLSIFSSYSHSFQPNTGIARSGGFFDPRESVQFELGLRAELSESTRFDVAAYRLTQSNLLTVDPADRRFRVPAGERRTDGVEMQISARISGQIATVFTYSYADNRITKPFFGLDDTVASGIPRHSASLRVDWSVGGISLYSLTAASGKRYGDARNTFRLPGYAVTDIGVTWTAFDMDWNASVRNLFNKRYVAAPFAEDDLYQGKRRAVEVRVSKEM